jgi:hypothetical protein
MGGKTSRLGEGQFVGTYRRGGIGGQNPWGKSARGTGESVWGTGEQA